jgi:hypothetical protein
MQRLRVTVEPLFSGRIVFLLSSGPLNDSGGVLTKTNRCEGKAYKTVKTS